MKPLVTLQRVCSWGSQWLAQGKGPTAKRILWQRLTDAECACMWDVYAEPFQKRQTLLIHKAYMEILPTEAHGVTSEIKGKLLWGASPAPGRQPALGTEAPLQAWNGYRGTREEQASPSVHAVFAHIQQSVPAVLRNRNLPPSDCQKGIFLRPWFCLQCCIFFSPQLPTAHTQC